MKINRPLMNPSSKDVDVSSENAIREVDVTKVDVQEKTGNRKLQLFFSKRVPRKSAKREEVDEQLSFKGIEPLGLKLRQITNTIKAKMRRRMEIIEVSLLWKSFAIPFMITTFVANILLLMVILLFEYENLPDQIRFMYDAVNEKWEQVDKSVLLILPVIIFILLAIQLRVLLVIFKKDRRLSLAIAWVMSFVNIIFLVSLTSLTRTYAIIW